MARPRRSQHTREALLDQGLQLFRTHGYHGTGLSVVLKALEVPKGSFYNFFSSKEAFVAEVIDRYSNQLLSQLDEAMAQWTGPSLDALRLAFQCMMGPHRASDFQDGCLVANMAGELGAETPLCQAALTRALDGMRIRATALIEKAQAEGSIRSDLPAEALADFVWDAWQGSLLRAKVERSPAPLERTVSFLFDDFLRPPQTEAPS